MKIRSKRFLLFFVACVMLLQTVALPTMAADPVYETIRVEAEDFLSRPTGDGIDLASDDSSQVVTDLGDTDSLSYAALDFGPEGVNQVSFRAWFGSAESQIEVRLDRIDGPLVGTLTSDKISSTEKWVTVDAELDGVTGEHDVFLVFSGDLKLNWFEFIKVVPFEPNLYLWFSSDPNKEKSRLDVSYRPNGGVGHDVVGHNDPGELFVFTDVDFSPVTVKIALSFSCGNDMTTNFELRLDSENGPVVASFPGKNTGGFDNFQEVVVEVRNLVGVHDLYFTSGETSDLAYLRLERLEEYDPTADIVAVADTKDLDEAKQRLGNLEIMIGDEGGFREEDSLTRAEATKVVVCMLGLGTTAASTTGAPQYTDMAADHWAVPYVNLATDMGIVAGMGNGEFWADTPLTNEQALKMVLHAGGYESMANENGGWPIGYIVTADDIGITYGMDLISNEKATRGDFAVFVNRMIETPMMVVKSTSKGTYVVSGDSGTSVQTLLKNYLKTDSYKATIETITNEKITIRVNEAVNGSDTTKVGKSFTFNKADIDLIFTPAVGEAVELCIKNQDFISLYQQEDESAIFDYIYAVNGDTDSGSLYSKNNIGSITLYLEDEVYDAAENLKLYYKGEAVDEAVSLAGAYAKATMDGTTITRLDVFPLTEGGIITSVSDRNLRYSYMNETYTLSHLDECDELIVVMNGQIATLGDLAAEMLVDYCQYGDNYLIAASATTINGTVTQILNEGSSEERIAIGTQRYWTDDAFPNGLYSAVGKTKEFQPIALASAGLSSFLNKEITAYVAPNGKIRYIWSRSTSTEFYGAIEKIWEDGEQYLKVYNLSDGEGLLASETYIVNLKNSDVDYDDLLSSQTVLDSVGKREGNQVYKFSLNAAGEVSKITNVKWIVRNRETNNVERASDARFNLRDGDGTYADDIHPGGGYIDAPDASIVTFDDGLPSTKMVPRTLTWQDIREHLTLEPLDGVNGNFAISIFADPDSVSNEPAMVIVTDGMEAIGFMGSNGAVIKDVYTYDENYTTVEIYRGTNVETYNLVNSVAYGLKPYMPVYYVDRAFTQPNFTQGIIFRAFYDIETGLYENGSTTGSREGEFRFVKDAKITRIAGSYFNVEFTDASGTTSTAEILREGAMVVFEIDPDEPDEYIQESFDNLSVGDKIDLAYFIHDGNRAIAVYYER